MLYTPLRDEQTDLYHEKNTCVESFDCMKHIIQNKMKVYKPMAQILSDAMEVFMREDIPTEYDDVAPSIQHEESDISAQLHLPVANCQSGVEIIDDMMSGDE